MDLWVSEIHASQAGMTFKVTDTLYHAQSDFQVVDIVETIPFGRMLLLDGRVMTTERDEFVYHEMIVHVPILSMPKAAERVLVIGGGDGGTVREVLRHPSVKEVVLCEIDGLVIDSCRQHLPTIAGQLGDPRVNIQVRDGVAYMAEQPDERFDVILIDSTDPIGPGEGLFTREFYRNVRRVLSPQGVMACQSESPIAETEEMTRTLGKLADVFPSTHSYIGSIPTYPSGLWSWTLCSKEGFGPFEHFNADRARELAQGCQYYNEDIHRAAFALPNFVRRIVENAQQHRQTAGVNA